jgi:NAD(P)-dependent dehydrogenase (short-subunit alcohol dehydrogenase family)
MKLLSTKMAAAVRERWGRTDVLLNNAGINLIAPPEKFPRRRIDAFLKSTSWRRFYWPKPYIINVASVAGPVGVADRAAYNPSLAPVSY